MAATSPSDTRLQVQLNGVSVYGLLSASIVTNNCFSSDSYALTFAMGPPPLFNISFWSRISSGLVQVSSLDTVSSMPVELISGMIDMMEADPVRGVVTVEGRDLSASLIDSYRQQDFVNQTASEVATTVASHHGLIPVITATVGSVGRYYGNGYTRLSVGQFSRLRSDWDLVVQLARENSFDLFVQGNSLYFQPPRYSGLIPVGVAFADVKSVRFEKSLAVSTNTIARVQAWDSQNMASYASSSSNGDGHVTPVSPSVGDRPFLFSSANLTAGQVTGSATRYAAELARLSLVLHIEMPWDLRISPRSKILIYETLSLFDDTYQVDHVERHYCTTSGSSQIIRATIASQNPASL